MEEGKMLIKDIKPIDERGRDLLKEDDYDARKWIEKNIELPLQKACHIFRKKGIKTVMSSANKSNILEDGEKPIEKEDVYGKGQEKLEERPTYEDAGKGYTWIMLDFDSLSDENKDRLFSLEERKGKNGEPIGEKAIWFVHPCKTNTLEFRRRIGERKDKEDKNSKIDERAVEFEKRHIVLAYNWSFYPFQTVILRMPVNQNSTVEEVENYFSQLAESLKSQNQELTAPDAPEDDIEH